MDLYLQRTRVKISKLFIKKLQYRKPPCSKTVKAWPGLLHALPSLEKIIVHDPQPNFPFLDNKDTIFDLPSMPSIRNYSY